ncbi:MAG: hypothetical protein AABZ61_05850, partial [Bacteroidota bacterium]
SRYETGSKTGRMWAHQDSPPEADQPLAENLGPSHYERDALTNLAVFERGFQRSSLNFHDWNLRLPVDGL